LLIGSDIFRKFQKYFDKSRKREAGGILLGQVYEDHSEIINVTGPNRFDFSGYNYFVRSKRGAQPKINKAWARSNGTLVYLGEWHTHFEKYPKPSATDKNLMANSLRTTKMEIDFLFLIIVGLDNTYWVGKQIGNKLVELKRIGLEY
jgi:integrative and conjugative element protein (TIGR02256 family)